MATMDSQPNAYEMKKVTPPFQNETRSEAEIRPVVEPSHVRHDKLDPELICPSADASPRTSIQTTGLLAALVLCLFVSALDATIISTAVPTISSDLNSAAGYTWVGGAYLLANAASGPIWATFSDVWGRKLITLLALAVFFIGSVACATAQTMRTLIAARALQGAAGGGLILLVHICVSDLFSMRMRSLLIGCLEIVWGVAGGVGPILGGVFASLLSWRWCFYINLPLCGIAFILISLFLNVKHEQTSFKDGVKSLDWIGIATFLACIIMLLLGLDFGGAIFPWGSAKVVSLIVVGALMIFAFVFSEARLARYPMIPLELFKQKSNVASLLVTFFHGVVFIAAVYYMPLYFQSVLGSSPLASGINLLPVVLTMAFLGIVTGVLIHRTGRFRELMWIGSLFLTAGTGLFIQFGVNTSRAQLIGFQIIAGIGYGLLTEPPLIAVQSQVDQQDIASATSTLTFVRDVASIVSLVAGAAVFQNSMDTRGAFLLQAGLSESVVNQLSGHNAEANVMIANTLSDPAQQLAVRQAFAWSIRNMWIMYTIFGFCGLVASCFVTKAHLTGEHTETVTGRKKKPEAVLNQKFEATLQQV